MQIELTDILRGGLPALGTLVVAILLVRVLCRRPALRRLRLALSLGALAGSAALTRHLVPAAGSRLDPYVRFLTLFAVAYATFKVAEVLVLDVLPGRRDRPPPPAILRDVVATLVGGVVLVVLLRASFGVDVAALVATSAALSIVLGFALQETLANLFAGLALMIERPFEPGDWVKLGSLVGRVKEVSWRAVRLQLIRQEDYLVIPNSVVAKSEIVNMSQPVPLHGHTVEIGVVYGEPPNRVREVLVAAAREVDGVLPDPPPRARVVRFDNFAVAYHLTYYIQDYHRINDIEGDVLAHVWYAFRRHQIRIPFPISDVNWRDATRLSDEERARELARVAGLLRGVEFLEALTPEQLAALAAEVRIAPFPGGLAVVREGEAGDRMFVIASGRVEVLVRPRDGGPERLLATMGPGDYFGEMSLLTGAPRSATIRTLEDAELLALGKDALRPLLLADPDVAERLSRTLAKRQAEREDVVQIATVATHDPETDLAGLLLGGIRRFFGLVAGDTDRRA